MDRLTVEHRALILEALACDDCEILELDPMVRLELCALHGQVAVRMNDAQNFPC